MNKPLISLCMIVGNVEDYIRRCLDSFRAIADEIVVVRAIGSAEPDKTLEICRDEYGAKVAEYKNRREIISLEPNQWHDFQGTEPKEGPDSPSNWPHVDDFAAARQMSFDLASADYCFWCDSDDIFEGDPEIVRQHAREGKYDCYMFPYRILGLGVNVPRERLIRKSAGHWDYPVHECFRFDKEPIDGVTDERVVVVHQPFSNKSGSNERNLRILRALNEDTMHPGLLYHLHGELIGIGDIPEACRIAAKAIEHPDLGKAEHYELLLVMARTATDPHQREVFLHSAYAADPCRREALGVLAGNAMDLGQYERALAYAQQMRATPLPRQTEWNHRNGFHGYIGDDIYQQALRVNGAREEAEKLRVMAFEKHGGPRITLLHATRGRPQKAVLCRKVWFDMADEPDRVEHIFAFDSDDEMSDCLRRFHHIELAPGGGCVAAWNMAANLANSNVLVQLSDDWLPCANWDRLILERLGNVNKPKVLAISDGIRNDQLMCMAICTRAFILQDWFLFNPSFTGVYSDNDFSERAYSRGQVIEAKDIRFEHQHPFANKEKWDRTYVEQNAPARFAEGLRILERIHAGTDWSSVPGYFNFWALYTAIARQLSDGDTVAEIGVWMGRSLIFLAQTLKDMGKKVKIIAVDTFRGEVGTKEHEDIVAAHGGSIRAAFEENCKRCGVADMISIIEGDSAESAGQVADASLAFCYIDAAHDYDSVRKDIEAWTPKVMRGGVLAGHDADWHEVKRAVLERFPEAQINGCIWMENIDNEFLPMSEGGGVPLR